MSFIAMHAESCRLSVWDLWSCFSWCCRAKPEPSPGYPSDDWLNIMTIHQNRAAHTQSAKNFIKESYLPNFFDFIVWGHEHECIPEAAVSIYPHRALSFSRYVNLFTGCWFEACHCDVLSERHELSFLVLTTRYRMNLWVSIVSISWHWACSRFHVYGRKYLNLVDTKSWLTGSVFSECQASTKLLMN